MTMSIGDFAREGIIFAAYTAWTDVLPGVLLAARFGPRGKSRPAPESAAAFALLSGVSLHLILWGFLRWLQLPYSSIQWIHAALISALALSCLEREVRAEVLRVGHVFLSPDVAIFMIVALATASYFTYAPIENYYLDELLRLDFAGSALRSFPAQNPLVWKGLLKYHYGADFFAACLSAETRIPLPIIYFRYFLVFNWTMLFIGMRGILKQAAPQASNLWALGCFGLFFFAPGNQISQLTFREMSFSLGLIALGASTLWTGFSSESAILLATASLCAGMATFAKAPGGSLYTAFVWIAGVLFLHARRIKPSLALAAMLSTGACWLAVYRVFLSGSGALGGGASIFRFDLDLGSIQILPAIFDARMLRILRAVHMEGKSAFLFSLENDLSLLIFGAMPLLALTAYFCHAKESSAVENRCEPALMLKAALATFCIGAFIFNFIHYKISVGSDRYWVWFSLWILSIIAYPVLATIRKPLELPQQLVRIAGLCLFVALASTLWSWPSNRRLANINVENWNPERQAACDYLRERSAPEALYLHNVLNRTHWAMSGLCNRRTFISYSTGDGVWENPSLDQKSRAEADQFFSGTATNPLGWLQSRGIQYVFWDRAAPQYGSRRDLSRYAFLNPVVSNGSVILYQVAAKP